MSAAYPIPYESGIDLQGAEANLVRIENRTTTFSTPLEGMIYFDTNSGVLKYRYVVDSAGATDADKYRYIPRFDQDDTYTGALTFNRGSSTPPFIVSATLPSVGSTATMVSNLNAQYISGYATSQSTTANTVAVRNSDGTLTVQDPVAATDAVNLQTVQAMVRNLDRKPSVRVATTTALPTNTRSGNVLTASSNGAFPTIDGVSLSANEELLVMYEGGGGSTYTGTSHANNGIYVVTSLGSAGAPWVLTRRSDADSSSEVTTGMMCFVSEGTVNLNSEWTLITDDPITLNTTALQFSKTGGNTLYIAGNGIVISGSSIHFCSSSGYTQGDMFYASNSTTVARLTAVAAGKVVASTGVSSAPAYSYLMLSGGSTMIDAATSGQLPIANGGTNSGTSLNNGRVMISSGGSIVERAAITANALTVGDASNGLAPLALGTANQILGMNSGATANEYKAFTVTSAGAVTAGTWNGTVIGVIYGGTGTTTSFTQGSVVFAGASGVYTENNSKFIWDNTNFRLGIATSSNINSSLVVTGGIVGWCGTAPTVNSVTNGVTIFTGEATDNGKAGIVGAGGASVSATPKINPLGSTFGAVGIVGAAGNTAGGRTSMGVYGHSLISNAALGNASNIPMGGFFLAEIASGAGSSTAFNGEAYGAYGKADTSGASASASSIVAGIRGSAVGKSGDTTYGGYFTLGTGGTTNYALGTTGAILAGGMIHLSGSTSSFPAIKRSSTTVAFRLADDSADASISASSGTFSGPITGNIGGESLSLKAGALDHVYLGLYARTATPSTRSGFFGYGGSGVATLTMTNEISNGAMNLTTTGTATMTLTSTTIALSGNMTLSGSATHSALTASKVVFTDGSKVLTSSGTVGVTQGGTGLATVAQGDIFYGSASNTVAALTKSTTANSYLKNSGTSNNPAWSTIAAADIVSGAALTKVDDTNVTLTLGGTPSTALLVAASITVGWTGTLAVSRGGIGVGTLASNAVLYGNGTSAVQALAVNSSATNKFLTQSSSGAPAWNTIVAGDISGLAVTWTQRHIWQHDSIGATADDTKGIALINTTAASSGNQQVSPAIRWRGQGWKTASTAASQSVDFRAYVLPVQGASSPIGQFVIDAAINGGSYANVAVFTDAGALTLTAGLTTTSVNVSGLTGSKVVFTDGSKNLTSSGTVGVTQGGTGIATVAQGDLLYGSAADTLSALAKSTTANSYLKNSGTSNNPAWSTIAASDIVSGAALTRTNDTNVTLTLGGSPTTALLAATSITVGWAGQLGLSRGGTNADLSATGGANQFLKQTSAGGTVTVAAITGADLTAASWSAGGELTGTYPNPTIVRSIAPTWTAQHIFSAASLGTTPDDAKGVAIITSTAAAAGAQQISPAIRWRGFGWKTNSTAASQAVDFRAYVVPVQGAAAPTGSLTFDAAINGGSYSTVATIDNSGTLTLTAGIVCTYITASAAVQLTSLSASSPVFTDASKNLTNSGTVPVTNGGTGQNSALVANRLIYASSTTAMACTAYSVPTSFAANDLIYASATNTLTAITTVASRILATDGSGNVAWRSDIPSGTTIGSEAVCRVKVFTLNTSATSYSKTHNWGTQSVWGFLRERSTNVITNVRVEATDTSSVTVKFTSAPTSNKYDLILMG